jgi:transcription initiation factor IIF auxiliary subunit
MAADYTILSTSSKNNRSSLVVEFAVPATNNSATVAWRDIVAELRAVEQAQADTAVTVNPRKVGDSVFVAQLDAGEIEELTMSVEYDAGLSNAGKVAVLDAAVIVRIAEYTTEFTNLYDFYGTDRTV